MMETGAKHLENHQIIRPQIKPLSKVAFFPENSHFFDSVFYQVSQQYSIITIMGLNHKDR